MPTIVTEADMGDGGIEQNMRVGRPGRQKLPAETHHIHAVDAGPGELPVEGPKASAVETIRRTGGTQIEQVHGPGDIGVDHLT
ncbi:MAG: hypothetical protein KL863_18560, partial [Rhizobium sp.]|nr:hypothetical protein [Rhizobium sp.]